MGVYKDIDEFELDAKVVNREFTMLNVGTEELEDYTEMIDVWIEFLKQKGVYEKAINRTNDVD